MARQRTDAVAGISNEAVKAKTGKTSARWIAILGAAENLSSSRPG